MKRRRANDRVFIMPDGSRTTKIKEYISAWRTPIEKFNKIAGTVTIGFDPGYLLGFKDGPGSLSIGYGTVMRIVGELSEDQGSTPNGYDKRWISCINEVLKSRDTGLQITDIHESLWDDYIGPMIEDIENDKDLRPATPPYVVFDDDDKPIGDTEEYRIGHHDGRSEILVRAERLAGALRMAIANMGPGVDRADAAIALDNWEKGE